MTKSQSAMLRALQRGAFLAGIAGVAFAGPIEMSSVERGKVERPTASEFGSGPRMSAKQIYRATLLPAGSLRLRQLQTVNVLVADASGRPVDDARIFVDGGMPEHRHGLPTRPIVKRSLGRGMYEIEGLRFSMGGWWELKLAIDSPAGSDRVTFNLAL